MKWGAVGIFVVMCAFMLATPGWGAGTAGLMLLDLADRDAVVLSVDGEALVSDLISHKLRPSRLEVLYQYAGPVPAAPQTSGDLVTAVEISPVADGFLLTLRLADTVPSDGEKIYREAVLGGGRTAFEVFAAGSARTPFKTAWLEDGVGGALPVQGSTPVVPVVERSVRYDAGAMTLTITGVGSDYHVTSRDFPARVDVLLPGAASDEMLGLVHKQLDGKITQVEVVPAKTTAGLVVRTSLSPGMGLINERRQGNDLVLAFGQPVGELTELAPQAAPASNPPAQPAPSIGKTMSATAGGIAPEQLATLGVSGVPQGVPSVEQILSAAQADAYRYGQNAREGGDAYGNYTLPGFEGEEELLSDVRVNLEAAGGFSLYQFLMYLSQISGISIIIDPYWLDQPFGTTVRQPQDPGYLPGEGGGAGFRPAGEFSWQFGGTGSIRGRFDNVPFDQALDIVLTTHNLRKVVYKDENDPYAKPIILITSKERLEQELPGQNEIDLYQLHYADPFQLYQILWQLNLLPSLEVGWYVYSGSGGIGGSSGGGSSGGFGGGGSSGGGSSGGGGRGGSSSATLGSQVATAGSVRNNYFDPMSIGQPLQGAGGVGGGGGGVGGGGGGVGGGGGGVGGGGVGGGGIPLPTAKAGLVVMRGTRETLDTVQSLIAKIDKPPKQVAIKIKAYQVSAEPQEVYGLIRATAQKDRIPINYELGSLSVNVMPKGGVLLDENYSAAFQFLQQDRKAKIITETEVAVIDGYNASIDSTRTRGQLSGTLVITADGQVINQPQFNPVDVGLQFDFTPQVDDRGRITLGINISLSNFDGPEQRASANGQEVTFQPTVETELNTILRIIDGQTVMIGGLTTSEDSWSFAGIPYLSKLPIIGPLFGRTEKTRSEGHIFITIQANIIDDK